MMAANWNTLIRGLIAGIVIFVSYRLAATTGDKLTPEWEAVLLVVIGYYFKDRPREDAFIAYWARAEGSQNFQFAVRGRQIAVEMLTQFVLALALVGFTVAAFIESKETSVAGAWIGAVVLAVGFFFKDSLSPLYGLHELLRTALAAIVTASTLLFVWSATFPPAEVPIQWVGVVFIVVAFYFKEKSGPNRDDWRTGDFDVAAEHRTEADG